jgi:hypothetical protein
MGDFNWDDDDQDNGNETSLMKDLRKQLEAAKQANKDMQRQMADVQAKARQTDVRVLLSELGVKNAKVGKFIPEDVEATKEGLTGWLKENGDVFGIDLDKKDSGDAPPAGDAGVPAIQPPPASNMSQDAVNALQRLQGVQPATSGAALSVHDQVLSGLQTAFDQTGDFKGFMAAAKKVLPQAN